MLNHRPRAALLWSGVAAVALLVSSANAGRLVMSQDINGFAELRSTATDANFVVNVADWLTESSDGQRILAVESAPGDIHRGFAPGVRSALSDAGYDVDFISATPSPGNLALSNSNDLNLGDYDAIFLGVTFPAPLSTLGSSALLDYVNNGGSLFTYGGVTMDFSDEADLLNPVLEAFGLAYSGVGNSSFGTNTSAFDHPIFNSVDHVSGQNGHGIVSLGTNDDQVELFGEVSDGAAFAAAQIIPEPSSLALLLAASLLLNRRR